MMPIEKNNRRKFLKDGLWGTCLAGLAIIAGVFAGYHFVSCLSIVSGNKADIPLGASLMTAFVGGVGGHLLYHLVYT